MRNFNTKKVIKAVLIGGALLWFTVWAWTPKHKTFYIDGKSVVMIDYNATEQDWKDAYLQWKAMRAADSYNRR